MEQNRRWWALVAVALGTFMTYLDNNVVNVALPSIQRELGLSISGLEWITSAYILVFAGLLLAGGRLGDVLGHRVVFLSGLGVFTVASVAAGLSGSQELLIGARAVQGIGAALLSPAALALIGEFFPDPKERGTAIGIWGAVGALALAVGPLTGGVLSQHVSWGWIFLINLPIGVATLVLSLVAMPRDGARTRSGGLDPIALGTSSVALFALTYALIEGDAKGWTSAVILGSFAVAALTGIGFVVQQARAADPMVNLAFFRQRMFTGGLLAMGLWAFGVFGIYFYMAIYLQNVLGFSPTEAGAGFVPLALITAVGAVLAPRLEARFGVARVTAFGLAVMGASIAGIARYGEGTHYLDLLPWFALYGVGGGLLIPLSNVVIGALPSGRAGIASGMLNVSREVFGLLGVTVLGAILSNRAGAATGTELHRYLVGYQFALVVAAALIVAGVPLSLWMLRTARPAPQITPVPVLETV
ncbi:multidrug MFS transporter [Actinoplanes sp. SE50]|uniref:MFS transporter n=1 Tax=unclassified Actinoplanes TaxID=2626549 RepID=UPI00023EC874|nr:MULTISPECIES: MFS transporter [unclassified Actinoplanes]AEV87628.1 Putative multidrug resistance protein mdtD [Actinoplanes sp. SE50/110]ATO86031.1 multidrug MFS transporter [Actinoplanes sp. SE50]SLM03445.1 multidrug MFS transporter [Actinoplanes sp. SE50/110]